MIYDKTNNKKEKTETKEQKILLRPTAEHFQSQIKSIPSFLFSYLLFSCNCYLQLFRLTIHCLLLS